MQKNSGENFGTIEVDPLTGEYHIIIPEWMINEYEWYEGTKVSIESDAKSLIISEIDES